MTSEPITAYGFQQNIINSLEDILLTHDAYYCYRDVHFLFKPTHQRPVSLVVNFNGAYGSTLNDRVVFRGYNYSIMDADILCISDSLLLKYPDLRLAWYLDTKRYKFNYIYESLVETLLSLRGGYKEIVFTGSSGGGLPALRLACKLGYTALISNSQIYPHKYPYYRELRRILGGDEPEDFSIERLCSYSRPGKMVIYQNIQDSHHYISHYLPFVSFIKNAGMAPIAMTNLFESFDGTTRHHSVQYPSGKKHLQVLQEYLDADLVIPELLLNVEVVGRKIYASCRVTGLKAKEELPYKYAFYLKKKGEGRIAFAGYTLTSNAAFCAPTDIDSISDLSVRAFAVSSEGKRSALVCEVGL